MRHMRPGSIASRSGRGFARPGLGGRSSQIGGVRDKLGTWQHVARMATTTWLPPAQACSGGPRARCDARPAVAPKRHELLGVRKRRLCSNRAVSGTGARAQRGRRDPRPLAPLRALFRFRLSSLPCGHSRLRSVGGRSFLLPSHYSWQGRREPEKLDRRSADCQLGGHCGCRPAWVLRFL
jgi:hypothetical protein